MNLAFCCPPLTPIAPQQSTSISLEIPQNLAGELTHKGNVFQDYKNNDILPTPSIDRLLESTSKEHRFNAKEYDTLIKEVKELKSSLMEYQDQHEKDTKEIIALSNTITETNKEISKEISPKESHHFTSSDEKLTDYEKAKMFHSRKVREITCLCGCGRKKIVKEADIKRGWGKFYSKSCKASYQNPRHG